MRPSRLFFAILILVLLAATARFTGMGQQAQASGGSPHQALTPETSK